MHRRRPAVSGRLMRSDMLIHLTCVISQSVESSSSDSHGDKLDSDEEDDDDDIEAQIRREVEGLKPSASKSRPFHAIRMDLPCRALTLVLLLRLI